jgi:ornithine carbamoyltransferase
MGEEHSFQERIDQLKAYQVNMELMRHTGNLDAGKVVFLHCLPAYHDGNTEMSKESGALEVTDDVFEADFSMVFDEAENRMHTIKALLVAGIGQ